ncbi:hypothetical protein N7457_008101 [Penicillium paradoxum]|uniref:uncharacterized protein n=1 Tax=Penicillium paradoxum TaxID=176176 RepID=UPI00254948D4|nr:uncharacterized protein N7457_008101 [Penicillium paradoxum]KAJ5773205.1 hypothetical protein N7457_008101 [Penicillium paradoxum]
MQHLQPPIHPQVLRLAIAKFSHTTTAIDHVGPLNWTHVQGNGDLTCCFEKFLDSGSVPSRLILNVLRGDGIQEQLDLVFFLRMESMQAQLVPPPKSHFAVVVKSPCLAVKYPHGGAYIRRFQIKFTTERDYFAALTLLGEINCPLTEGKIPIPANRRFPSVSSWTSGNLSSIIPMTTNTMATSTGSNGAFHPTGALASGRTTPMRPSSPASTISHPVSRLGPLPLLNHPAQSVEPADLMRPIQAPIPLAQPSHKETEPPSSQLSATSATHDVDQLNQMLPPKRDLPFPKPAAKKRRNVSPTKASQKQAKLAPSPNSQLAEQTIELEPCPLLPILDLNTCVLLEPTSQVLSQPDSCPEASQPLLLYEEPPGSQSTFPINPSADQAFQAPVIPAQTLNNTTNPSPGQVTKPNNEAAATTEDHLAQYLSSPTAERIAFLENWMSELLEDDKFLSLCRDVEGTWKRFVLGQKK